MAEDLLSRLIVKVGQDLTEEHGSSASYAAGRVLGELGITQAPTLDATLVMDTTPSAPLAELPPFGRYQVMRQIGSGGAGEIYEGYDPELRRPVAIKVLRADLKDREVLERFVAEAQVTAQLEHPGIVPVHDFGVTVEGRLFYVMKRVFGRDLFQILGGIARKEEPLATEWSRHRRLTSFVQICRAVAYAHERGVVHRDLKPGNLMFGDHGESLVMDWGIARVLKDVSAIERHVPHHTVPGATIGTIGYMSPEQMMGAHEHLKPASDVWSLGVILYETLTVRRALRGTLEEVSARASEGPLEVTGFSEQMVPTALRQVIEKATSVKLADRHENAGELADAVDAFLARVAG